jgi:nucleoside 2-deoxyribosyltransferase
MVEEKKRKCIYICGPAYHPEERKSMNRIANYLESNGFNTYLSNKDGIESFLLDLTRTSKLDALNFKEFYDIASRASFALEIYSIIERCDATLFCLNGRVPDEAGIFKAAVTFGAGKPVINYKYDARILFPNGVNPMISGLSPGFKIVKRYRGIIKRLAKLLKQFRKYGANRYKGNVVPPYVQKWINLGREVAKYLEEIRWSENKLKDPEGLMQKIINRFKDTELMRSLIPSIIYDDLIKEISIDPKKKRIYCSGALFCPTEVSEMAKISNTLEDAGYDTYLPQRDGGETILMMLADNPFAGSNFTHPISNFLSNTSFALDIYEILKCDYFLINLNGRVPDDGAISELGVAFAAGKPIVQFKSDIRSMFNGRDHPMISGATSNLPSVSQLGLIPNAIEQIANYVNSFGENQYFELNIPHNVKQIIDRGFKVWKFLHDKKKPKNKMATLM